MRCTWSNVFHIFAFQLQVVFWKWITPKLLGLVTQTSVYHWSIEGDSEPTKMFDRTANLANNQIINYRCDPAEKWLVLIGIAPGAPEVRSYWFLLLVTSLLILERSHIKWVLINKYYCCPLSCWFCSKFQSSYMIPNTVSVKISCFELELKAVTIGSN
jgi:hypothetical protein